MKKFYKYIVTCLNISSQLFSIVFSIIFVGILGCLAVEMLKAVPSRGGFDMDTWYSPIELVVKTILQFAAILFISWMFFVCLKLIIKFIIKCCNAVKKEYSYMEKLLQFRKKKMQ